MMKFLERLVERPPRLFRALFPGATFRIDSRSPLAPKGEVSPDEKTVYLTFDDGPIPEVTPKVLDILDSYGVKATFFMVGENVDKYRDLMLMVRKRGHSLGSHTYHHIHGMRVSPEDYLENARMGEWYIDSYLFRPPHGWLSRSQLREVQRFYHVVMYDVVTRDYCPSVSPERILQNVKDLARPGSIIVFHDSLKSWPRLKVALPKVIEWLLAEGYTLRAIPENPDE